MPDHTIDQFVAAFGLVKKGREFVGPCPICKEGEDRFHVKEGADGKPVFGCRYCIDGGEDNSGERAKAVFALLDGKPVAVPAVAPTNVPMQATEPPKPRKLPNGKNDTRYDYVDAEGNLVFVVMRHDSANGKRFSQWTPVEDNNGTFTSIAPSSSLPMFRLLAVAASGDKVAICEGEKCVEAAARAWPNQLVSCWAGGTNSWQKTDWQPLAGRKVSLLADGDEPGHKAMLALAGHLHGLGCTVKIALPPVEWGTDVADWLAEGGPNHAGKIIGELLVDYEPPVEDAQEPLPPTNDQQHPLDQLAMSGLQDNDFFQILGLIGDNVAIKKRTAGRIYQRSPEQVQQIPTLVNFASQTWWASWTGEDKLNTEKARAIGDSIIRVADELGQIDQALFYGRGAVRFPNGKVGYHLGDRLFIEGHEYGLNDENSMVWLAEPRLELGGEATDLQTAAIARAVMRYRWASDDDGRRFLGWIVAAIVGGALEWRPHLMVTARATEGKTWILSNVLEPIMGDLVTSISDATPAAVAKVREYSSLPIAIDEAEPTQDWVIEILNTLRAASSNFGARIRVAPGNAGVVYQQARFCALLSATAAPAMNKADESRLSPVGFGPPVEDWPAVRLAITTTLSKAAAVRYRIIRRAAEIIRESDRLAVEMQDMGMDSREALSSAALTAGWRFWGLDDKEVFSQPESNSMNTDASDALLEILAFRIRLDGGDERSILQLLGNPEYDLRIADLYGIRKDVEGLLVANKHRGLSHAMVRSKWASTDLRKLLLQMDGAAATELRKFGNWRARSVLIPHDTLRDIGVTFWDDDDEPMPEEQYEVQE